MIFLGAISEMIMDGKPLVINDEQTGWFGSILFVVGLLLMTFVGAMTMWWCGIRNIKKGLRQMEEMC